MRRDKYGDVFGPLLDDNVVCAFSTNLGLTFQGDLKKLAELAYPLHVLMIRVIV